jgi:hypothetical protein
MVAMGDSTLFGPATRAIISATEMLCHHIDVCKYVYSYGPTLRRTIGRERKFNPLLTAPVLSLKRGMSSPMTTSTQGYEVLLLVSSGSTAKANVMYF